MADFHSRLDHFSIGTGQIIRFQRLAVHNLERAFAGHGLTYAVPSLEHKTFLPNGQSGGQAIIEAMSKVYALVITAGAFSAVASGGEYHREGAHRYICAKV